MKKLIVALMVLSTFVSCGKKNAIGTTSTTFATSPISTINSDGNFQSLSSAIASTNFNEQYANYYTEYHYGDVANTCIKKDGWFGIDYMSCSASISNETIKYHGQVDVTAKRAELNAILAKTVVFNSQGSTYALRTNDNYTYIIRTDFPIQANPVYKLNNADGKANRLIQIK